MKFIVCVMGCVSVVWVCGRGSGVISMLIFKVTPSMYLFTQLPKDPSGKVCTRHYQSSKSIICDEPFTNNLITMLSSGIVVFIHFVQISQF